ncbi:hypothetical protein JCM21142_52171 [Saccharicrinis fermentans DSM 9555 = JCM 21142]|uniref:Uncharacterized protein n=1 Tax=Saccharicrinis fermentans DSM 9555 = JCM 21142 TaxID=869213 RepID=W7YM70_9BACT|nr:hypothetical protein JCM21142_52171 [Saccharicrinis fermentans DSM 9555 = JCM 21142]
MNHLLTTGIPHSFLFDPHQPTRTSIFLATRSSHLLSIPTYQTDYLTTYKAFHIPKFLLPFQSYTSRYFYNEMEILEQSNTDHPNYASLYKISFDTFHF